MSKNARDNRPYIRPVTRIELSEGNIRLRWIAIALLLAIAVAAIGYGVAQLVTTEPGWQEVSTVCDEVNISTDFVLMYDFSAGDANPSGQFKKLQSLYSDLAEEAYRLFSPEAQGNDNLFSINANLNKAVTVAPGLYHALEQIAESGSRHPFMGPVQSLYDPVFLSQGDAEAAHYDPLKEPELQALAQQTAAYCADPEMISLELLGGSQVRLNVAEAYMAFAGECGIETFLDFGWMRNAFAADYMAEALAAQGFVYGYLSSYDGFTRNLDIRGTEYTIGLFDRQGNDIMMPANLSYNGPLSIVSLRDYPLSEQDRWKYYSYENGDITTVFLDPADGMSKSAADSIMGYGRDLGCGEILLRLAPVFTADALNAASLGRLAADGVDTLWFEGDVLYHTQEDPALMLLEDSGGAGYSTAHAE